MLSSIPFLKLFIVQFTITSVDLISFSYQESSLKLKYFVKVGNFVSRKQNHNYSIVTSCLVTKDFLGNYLLLTREVN